MCHTIPYRTRSHTGSHTGGLRATREYFTSDKASGWKLSPPVVNVCASICVYCPRAEAGKECVVDLDEFVASGLDRLLRFAHALTGDAATAEDVGVVGASVVPYPPESEPCQAGRLC